MTKKEVIEFSNLGSKASEAMEPVVREFLKENPDVSYTRVNYDEDPDLLKAIISSQVPTISPFFVSFKDGKAVGSAAGLVSKEDLTSLTK
jgi:thioredoxin-like negative regulator of GroEL